VLLDDPFELGVDRLKDVRIAGTVFEGTPHMLAAPVASLHASVPAADDAPAPKPARRRRGATARWRLLNARCCGTSGDVCDIGRQWITWAGTAARTTRPPVNP
jgi:hypothetical protein